MKRIPHNRIGVIVLFCQYGSGLVRTMSKNVRYIKRLRAKHNTDTIEYWDGDATHRVFIDGGSLRLGNGTILN